MKWIYIRKQHLKHRSTIVIVAKKTPPGCHLTNSHLFDITTNMSLFPPRLGTVVHDPKYKFQNTNMKKQQTITKTEIKLPINGNKYAKHSINKKQINDNAKDAEDERKCMKIYIDIF